MLKGSKNKGDWSELYAMLYLLGTRDIYTADEKLDKIASLHFPISKVSRKDYKKCEVDFVLTSTDGVEVYLNHSKYKDMVSSDFKAEADFLLPEIPSGSKSFTVPRSEKFLNDLGCKKLSAPSSQISDINVELHDPLTGYEQMMGFSIKSYLGGAPTLLNASRATNFIFEITGIDSKKMTEINAIESKNKIQKRIDKILKSGGSISFVKTANDCFNGNLMMIDSQMASIISEVLLYSYTKGITDCKEIIEHLEKTNPLKYPRDGLYSYKFKKFLCSKALGMDPSKKWSGTAIANGGFIVVKKDGEVLAYHVYNRDKFEQYLYESTKLERASTARHDYARIYVKDGKMYINLNLQIRFKD